MIASVLAAAAAAAGLAGDIGKPVEGYVYFHKAGADMAAHDAAVAECSARAFEALPGTFGGSVAGPDKGIIPNIVADLIYAKIQGNGDRLNFNANLENCMVIRGWEVIRLPDEQGKALAAQTQPQIAAALAPWVGAKDPPGELARTYAPLAEVGPRMAAFERALPPLSLLAVATAPARMPRPVYERVQLKPLPPGAALAPGASGLVVRATTVQPIQNMFIFARTEDGPKGTPDGGKLTLLWAASPVKFLGKAGTPLERNFLFEVPPGHWRMLGTMIAGYCLEGPVFDIKPGEVVYAGDFDARSRTQADLDMAPIRPWAEAQHISDRMQPAAYRSEVFSCAWEPRTYIYRLPADELVIRRP